MGILKILKDTFTRTFITMRCSTGNPLKNIDAIVNKSINDVKELKGGKEENGNNEKEE